MEQFVGLYVFVTYLEETDFLFDRQSVSYELDFYGSFYAAVVSFACSLLAALVVYMDESISKVHKECSVPNGNVEYMLPEELMLYAPYDWNVMDDREYDDDDDDDDHDVVAQNDVDRCVYICVDIIIQYIDMCNVITDQWTSLVVKIRL